MDYFVSSLSLIKDFIGEFYKLSKKVSKCSDEVILWTKNFQKSKRSHKKKWTNLRDKKQKAIVNKNMFYN